jgi:hypothetical protein
MNLKLTSFCVCNLILFFFNQLQPVIIFGSKYSTIKIDSDAACIIENPLHIQQGVVTLNENGIITGAPIIFENGTIIDSGNKLKLTGIINPDTDTVILNGNGNFSGRNGTCYQPVFVSGKNNLISGSLAICNDITLQDSNTTVSVDLIPNLNANIYLNGGVLYIMENYLKFNDGFRLFGPGAIYESGSKLIHGALPLTFNEDLYFSNAQDIQFGANVTLQSKWTFSGNSTVDGNSNLLSLENGKIFIEKGSSLLIKNMTLHGVHDGNLICLDNKATVTFQNVTIYLDNEYTFSIGQFMISDQVTILGDCKFIYQSQIESIILSKSTLTLDQGITFSYDPGCMKQDLIVFEDAYSTLELDGATLHATMTGMQLTTGSLVINSNSYLSSEKHNTTDQGITFGNDTAQDDLYCQVSKGSILELTGGSLKYRNVLPTSWTMGDNLSSIKINTNSSLYLYENLNIEPGFLNYANHGGFFYAPGKNVTGIFNVNGYVNYLELS